MFCDVKSRITFLPGKVSQPASPRSCFHKTGWAVNQQKAHILQAFVLFLPHSSGPAIQEGHLCVWAESGCCHLKKANPFKAFSVLKQRHISLRATVLMALLRDGCIKDQFLFLFSLSFLSLSLLRQQTFAPQTSYELKNVEPKLVLN